MDVTRAIIETLFAYLAADEPLGEVMGSRYSGPHYKPPKDTPFPYITQNLETLEAADRATRAAIYTLTIWDYGENGSRIFNIRGELMRLLDNARFTIPNQGILRLWHVNDIWVPDEDPNILRLTMTFEGRYNRSGEIQRISTNKGE
jgi:hypothetical protein